MAAMHCIVVTSSHGDYLSRVTDSTNANMILSISYEIVRYESCYLFKIFLAQPPPTFIVFSDPFQNQTRIWGGRPGLLKSDRSLQP